MFFVCSSKSRLRVVVVIISVQSGVLQRRCSLDLCTHNLPRTYFFEHIWMRKHQRQERQNYIFENASESLILQLERLAGPGLCMKLDVLHGRGHRAALSPVSERILWEGKYYLICFISRFGFFTIRTMHNLELTGTILGPLNVCVQNQRKAFFCGHTVYSIPIAPLE